MPASGTSIPMTSPVGDPPSSRKTCPDAWIVNYTILRNKTHYKIFIALSYCHRGFYISFIQ